MNITTTRLQRVSVAALAEGQKLVEDLRLFTRKTNGRALFRQAHAEGMSLLVKANEDVGRELYFFRQFEPSESKFLTGQIKESDICVDIGANVGFYTLSFGKKACRGVVHSFEPVPLNYHVLAVNVLSNCLPNVVMNNCAVGDKTGDVKFCVARDGAFSSLVDTGREAIVEQVTTRIVTLDSYCSTYNVQRVDVLKVDVEGAEMAVLRGARQLLSDNKSRPRLIMLELFGPMLEQFGSTIDEITEFMHEHTYSPFVFIGDQSVPFAKAYHDKFYNVLFMPGSI